MTTQPMKLTKEQAVKRRFFIAMYDIIDMWPPEEPRSGKPGRKSQFARSIGWSEISLYLAESNPNRGIPLKCLIAICEVYNVSPHWLLLGTNKTPNKRS